MLAQLSFLQPEPAQRFSFSGDGFKLAASTALFQFDGRSQRQGILKNKKGPTPDPRRLASWRTLRGGLSHCGNFSGLRIRS